MKQVVRIYFLGVALLGAIPSLEALESVHRRSQAHIETYSVYWFEREDSFRKFFHAFGTGDYRMVSRLFINAFLKIPSIDYECDYQSVLPQIMGRIDAMALVPEEGIFTQLLHGDIFGAKQALVPLFSQNSDMVLRAKATLWLGLLMLWLDRPEVCSLCLYDAFRQNDCMQAKYLAATFLGAFYHLDRDEILSYACLHFVSNMNEDIEIGQLAASFESELARTDEHDSIL